MLPDTLRAVLSRVRSRLRARAIAHRATLGGALFATLLIAAAPIAMAVSVAVVATIAVAARRWRIDDRACARIIEAHRSLDNLLITATEIDRHPRPLRAEIREAILQQAAERSAAVDTAGVVPLLQPAAAGVAVVIGCVLLSGIAGGSRVVAPQRAGALQTQTSGNAIAVTVTPPAYTKKVTEAYDNPAQLTILAGSRVRITAQSRVLREWVATASESLDLRVHDDGPSRFLSVIVVPDAPPTVRITEPGRDTAFASSNTSLALGVDSRDDLGLTNLALRYTKASGGGENVTFAEGEVPLTVERVSERHWRARAQWPLAGLGLADGDVLVYRAISRDANPGGAPVESDAFLVEIGRTAEIASAGFALPTEEKKYAISQQMVIYKTEQLLANRAKHADDWLEQTRMLGVEQRMVRAEVVFLSGGEVQDEVEEAAHSHELAEGRLENQGRAEMVRALNFMSRAEAQLNDGNAAEALGFERQALASLERALDRRRYFLRTLPDRSRIDVTRRLTGERRDARSWLRDRTGATAVESDRLQAAMRDLIAALADRSRITPSLAARVAAVEPASPELQSAAVAIANAASADDQRHTVQAAMEVLTKYALTTLPGSTPVSLPTDPLAGRLGDAMARPRR